MHLILTLLMVIIFTKMSFAQNEQFIVIDSLCGKVEVQRAGNQKWQFVNTKTKLYNNDRLHVLDKGFARLIWPDESTMYLQMNSKILLNIFSTEKSSVSTSNATVFSGAVFFVVKKTAPGELIPISPQIYTPTAVISLRGTTTVINVDASKNTNVKVLNGTVLIHSIATNCQAYLTAPYQTTLNTRTNSILRQAIERTELDELKSWIPASIIDEDMILQADKSERDHTVLNGKYTEKLIVFPFVNKSNYDGKWPICKVITSHIFSTLSHLSKEFTLDSYTEFPSDIDSVAQEKQARYYLTGIIEKFEIVQRAEIPANATETRENTMGVVTIRIRLFDIIKSDILLDEKFTGNISENNKTGGSWEELNKLPCDMNNRQFAATFLGCAINQAVEQAAEKVCRSLAQ